MKMTIQQFIKNYKPDNKTLRELADYSEPIALDEHGDVIEYYSDDCFTCNIITYACGCNGGIEVWLEGNIYGLDITAEGDNIEEVYTELQAALYETLADDTAAHDAWIYSR